MYHKNNNVSCNTYVKVNRILHCCSWSVADAVALGGAGDMEHGDRPWLWIQAFVLWHTLDSSSLTCVFVAVQVATIQGLSGTGSLRIGAAFIQRYMPRVPPCTSPTPPGATHRHSSPTPRGVEGDPPLVVPCHRGPGLHGDAWRISR